MGDYETGGAYNLEVSKVISLCGYLILQWIVSMTESQTAERRGKKMEEINYIRGKFNLLLFSFCLSK